jgi:hypothetical protein
MTPETIRSAWAKSGILAGDPRVVDPQIILKQLPGGHQEKENSGLEASLTNNLLTSLSLGDSSSPLTPERPILTTEQFETPGDFLAFNNMV